MKTHPRREFLLRVLAACGAPFIAPSVSVRADQSPQPASAALRRGSPEPEGQRRPGPQLDRSSQAAARYFGAAAGAARAIGEAYLRQLQLEPERESILEHTRGALQIIASARTQRAATTALVGAVRRDFQEGRILQLEGWIVSRTEVELCMLTLLPAPI
jgi:hypothetical protein